MTKTNERLRSTLINSGYNERRLAEELGLDPKSVQRWITRGITPRRTAAYRTARLLDVPATWLWPGLDGDHEATSRSEIVTHYAHRASTPRQTLGHRTHPQLDHARRNVRDYERLPAHSEAHIAWAAITLMTRRLTRIQSQPNQPAAA